MLIQIKKKMQYLAVLSATMNTISYGLAVGWPSPSLPKLFAPDSPIPITHSQGSWLSVMPFAGPLIGSPIAAVLADKFGRKPIILFTAIPYITSWLIIGLFESIESLMLARALAGIGGGGLFTVVPTYITEVTEPQVRGKLCAMITWMWNFGVLMIYVCGPFVSIKIMAFISISVPVLFVLSFVWMPESPYFYLMRNKTQKAKTVLKMLREKDNVDQVIDDIENELSMTSNVMDIFKYSVNRKSVFFVLTITAFQELSGRSPILFYSQAIFQEANKNIPAAYISMIYGFVQLITSFVFSFVVDKFKRKSLLIFSCTGTAFCMAALGLFFFLKYNLNYNLEFIKWLPVIILIIFIIIFNVGLGFVPLIMAGELFATNVKSNGMCLLDLFYTVITSVVTKYFQIMSDEVGVYVPFWTFSMFCLLGTLFTVTLLPETRGLTLEEIQQKLKK